MDSQPDWAAVLESRFRLVREIGRGGMATVYLAEDVESGDQVAVKVLGAHGGPTPEPARFEREIRIAGTLDHPHILPVLDSGRAGEFLYYVMPYVDGPSLAERLEAEGALSLDETLAIVDQLVRALDYAHEAGVVHRDVKPENILLEGDTAYLADFGVARFFEGEGERLTGTGQSVGTAEYSSPEQSGGEARIDARADVYSVACVTYEMLAGEPPFTGPTRQSIVARHMAQAPPGLDVVRPDLPEHVVAAVARALAKVPADRFSTAGKFAEALRSPALAGDRRRRMRGLVAGMVALVVIAAIGAGVFLWPSGPSLDRNKVVVFPLASTSEVQDRDAGWDAALAVGAALEHADPLKFIDGWAWLSEAQRRNPASLTAAEARSLARDRDAAFFTAGVIRRVADSLSVTIRLHDTAGDSLIAQATVTAPAGSRAPGQLGMRAVLGLLPRLVDPERMVDLTPLTDRQPGATALFLQGERAYRESRFGDALELYRRAVAEDSLHVFAAVKGAQAASWDSDFGQARDLIRRAVEHRDWLPPKYAAFAVGLEAYLQGDPRTAGAAFREALAVDAEWPEALTALGEVYMHLLPEDAVRPDSVARSWFRRAWRADSTFGPPVYHLAEIALRAGELPVAERLIGQWARFDPDPQLLDQLRLSLACLRRDNPGSFDWASRIGGEGRTVLLAALSLGGRASQADCAGGAYAAILDSDLPRGHRWAALKGLTGLAMARGEYERVDSLIEVHRETGLTAARTLFVHYALAGGPFGEQASAAEARLREVEGNTYEGAPPHWRWIMGVWLAHSGEVERAEAVARAMEVAADTTGDRETRLLARALPAHVAAARGQRARALEVLEGLTPDAPRDLLAFWESESLAPERLLRAELLLAEGRAGEAYGVAALLDHPSPQAYLAFLPRSLAVRLEAARAARRRDRAEAMDARLSELGWTRPPTSSLSLH